MLLLTLLACGESPLGVNEIGPSWLEVYNPRNDAVDFEGWSVEIDGQSWSFGPGSVAPRSVSYAAEPADTEADWTLDLQLPADGGTLTVFDADQRERQVIQLPAFEDGASFGRIPDGSANWQVVDDPSPGRLNERAD